MDRRRRAEAQLYLIKAKAKKGPGRGWHGPPKGTHGAKRAEKVPGHINIDPAGSPAAARALRAVGGAHGLDKVERPVEIRITGGDLGGTGIYEPDRPLYGQGAPRISISSAATADEKFIGIVHEMGHHVDYSVTRAVDQAASKMSFGQPTKTNAVMGAIEGSQAQRKLIKARDKAAAGKSFSDAGDAKYLSYALNKDELFSRAYVQYVTGRAGPAARETFKKERAGAVKETPGFYWEDADFEPIAEALDGFFN